MEKDEKPKKMGSRRGDEEPRIFSADFYKTLGRTRLRDISVLGLLAIGYAFWTGSEKLLFTLDERIANNPRFINLQERVNELYRESEQHDDTLDDHEARLRYLERRR